MKNEDLDIIKEKTYRFALLCMTVVFCSLWFFLFKVKACDNVTKEELCHEEFIEITSDTHRHKCFVGASVEVVNSPPAPKAGIMCHCINNRPDASTASSAQQK
ncbi:hypothetical protein UFOVP1290_316 [uncultured Caudovirales phage]|uniref:Uncharacterized protein n=1 Tax=uncultured Caudovirales phage TaxID=2100421 RepID=A0A6J5RR65_9CAUD|nr:hypothetical protein UFOVP1290_316 [uncultured Caudovirales phage]